MKRIITIPSSELTNRFDENLMIKLRNEVEGKCNREGYIEKGSVEIIDHGTLDTEVIRYKGDVRVRVTFTGKVVSPVFGEIVECQVRRYNDFGVMATAGPLNIVIPFSDKNETTFNVGQKIKVKVIESTLVLNDDHIDVYATFHDEKTELKTNKLIEEDILDTYRDEDADEIESDDAEDVEETGNEVEEGDEYDDSESESESDAEDDLNDSDEEEEGYSEDELPVSDDEEAENDVK